MKRAIFAASGLALALGGFVLGRATSSSPRPARKPPERSVTASVAPVAGGPASSATEYTPLLLTPKRLAAIRFLDELDEDDLHRVLRSIVSTEEWQRRLWNRFQGETDPAALEFWADLLCCRGKPELTTEILKAFDAETRPEWRAALAVVIGGRGESAGTLPVVLRILQSPDAGLHEKVLSRFSVSLLGRCAPEINDVVLRIRDRLQEIVRTSPSAPLRRAAVRSLSGVYSREDVQFLVDTLMRDPDPDVQLNAMWALPLNWSSTPDVETARLQILAARDAALDTSRDGLVRRRCADRAMQMNNWVRDRVLVDAECAALKNIKEGRE